MNIFELQNNISGCFNPAININHAPDGVDIHFITHNTENEPKSFDSLSLEKIRQSISGGMADAAINQNKEFSYPVFTPSGKQKNDKAILLLHGLNERRWDKYYTWAHQLVKRTGKSVILFPISFHLNRGLPVWIDRKKMAEKSEERKLVYNNGGKFHSFVNQALSERLTETPERFFTSGLQTANDIVSMMNKIKNGNHSLFTADTKTDIFAYSIGGLLAQVLFLSNPDGHFKDSKLFLFCAGSFFVDMYGVSKLIMDPPAYKCIYHYYTVELEEKIKKPGVLADFFNNSKIGMAFRSMLKPETFQLAREKIFSDKSRQIFALSLKKDMVIPPTGIKEALIDNRKKNMEIIDFEFPYSHEAPFPMSMKNSENKINEAFEKVFNKAALFLS